MTQYKEREEVLMSLERYEEMKDEISKLEKELDEIRGTFDSFYMLSGPEYGKKATIYVDKIESWIRSRFGERVRMYAGGELHSEAFIPLNISSFEYVRGEFDGTDRT